MWRDLRDGSFTGDPGRYVKKGFVRASLSIVAPLRLRGTWNQEGGARIPGTLNDE